MSRYKVVPHRQGLEVSGWGIWDEKLSPSLHVFGYEPTFCSLDGETPLLFPYMTGAYGWLAWCEAHGLDLEAGNVRTDVYGDAQSGGVIVVSERGGEGPAVNAWPLGTPQD
jgi:hypothetical protein